jgi:hypothetical protein
MGSAEISSRILQEFDKRADWWRFCLGLQFCERPALRDSNPRFYFDPADVPAILDLLRRRLPEEAEAIVQQAEQICAHRFSLLGFSDVAYEENIDWHCDAVHRVRSPLKPFFRIDYFDPAEVGDAKIIWELNRHKHLVTLAKAYRLTGNAKFAQEAFSQWYSWREHNPYPLGINWSSSLEAAFRALSWLWLRHLLDSCDVMPAGFQQDLLRELSVHGRYIERFLSTYTSPNTHLLGEAVGLFALGTLCPQLPSAARWKQTGWKIILEEAVKQVRSDGFHFEQSTYYHVYALDLFLHARRLAERNQVEVPEWFDGVLVRMLQALRDLCQSGLPASFGDDDGGRVFDPPRNRREHLRDPLSTGAVLFRRGDFKHGCQHLREETLWLLGPSAGERFDEIVSSADDKDSRVLPAAGIYVMRGGSTEHPAQLTIDAGPQGTHNAGHGHADALSVQLSTPACDFLCDPGTFEYCGDGKGRAWFRSTPAHNTLTVDEVDQAEPNGSFGWSSLPITSVERWHTGKSFDIFHGSHTGYRRLPSPVTHERWVIHFKGVGWIVRDVALGAGSHSLDVAWHWGLDLSPDRDLLFSRAASGEALRLAVADDANWAQEWREEGYSPAYGVKTSARVLHVRHTGQLPAETAVFLETESAGQSGATPVLKFEKGESCKVRSYLFFREQQLCGCIFSESGQVWSQHGFSSDADLLGYRLDRSSLKSLCVCNATFVDWNGRRLWSGTKADPYCELADGDGELNPQAL